MQNFVEIYYQPLILSTTTCHNFLDADRTKKQQDRLLRETAHSISSDKTSYKEKKQIVIATLR
jgi:hypothetical protein